MQGRGWTRNRRVSGQILLMALMACVALASLGLVLHASPAHASTCESQDNYVGAPGGAWDAEANWSNKVPKGTETVCIPEGKGTIEVPSGVKAEAKSLTAQSPIKIVSTGTLAILETTAVGGVISTIAGLDVESGAHLTTAGGWIYLTGTNSVEGEISQTKVVEAIVRLISGTLSGDGTIAVRFNNQGGTLEPGGAGTIGTLHFTMLDSQSPGGTLRLDVSSSSFDRLSDTTSNFFLEGTLEIDLLGGYEPPVKTKFEFMSGGPGDSVEFETVSPAGFTARSVSGGAEVEVTERPPTAVTEPATSVTQTSAVLNATVNPNLQPVTICLLELGTAAGVYGTSSTCPTPPGSGSKPVAETLALNNLTPGTTYHYRISADNTAGPSTGVDRSFTTLPATKAGGGGEEPETGATIANTQTSVTGAQSPSPKLVEELLLGCSKSELVLNDAYIHRGRVLLIGSAAKSLTGKKVSILFNEKKQVATATVGADGRFSTTAPLPPAKIREALTTRYSAAIGKVRSLHLKLTRRLLLEPPTATGDTVTLQGKVTKPLTRPIAPIVVEQQLECGRITIVKQFTPPAGGVFHLTLSVPAGTKAAIYTLKSKVAANAHALAKGFTTYSLPLPVAIG